MIEQNQNLKSLISMLKSNFEVLVKSENPEFIEGRRIISLFQLSSILKDYKINFVENYIEDTRVTCVVYRLLMIIK